MVLFGVGGWIVRDFFGIKYLFVVVLKVVVIECMFIDSFVLEFYFIVVEIIY